MRAWIKVQLYLHSLETPKGLTTLWDAVRGRGYVDGDVALVNQWELAGAVR